MPPLAVLYFRHLDPDSNNNTPLSESLTVPSSTEDEDNLGEEGGSRTAWEKGGSRTAWEGGGGASVANQNDQNGQIDNPHTPLAAAPSLPAQHGSESVALLLPEHPPPHLTAYAEGGEGAGGGGWGAMSGLLLDAVAGQSAVHRSSLGAGGGGGGMARRTGRGVRWWGWGGEERRRR